MLRGFVFLGVCVFVCLLVGWLVCAFVFDLCGLCSCLFSCVFGLCGCLFDGLLSLDLFLIYLFTRVCFIVCLLLLCLYLVVFCRLFGFERLCVCLFACSSV